MTDVLVLSGLVCVLMLAGAWLGRRRMRIEYARWLIEQRKLQKPSAFEWEMVKLTVVAVQGFAETLGRAMLPALQDLTVAMGRFAAAWTAKGLPTAAASGEGTE